MPLADNFVLNYLGFSDDQRPTGVEITGSPGDQSVDIVQSYNPLIQGSNDKAYVVVFNGTVDHSIPFRQIARSDEITSIERSEVEYFSGVTTWDGLDVSNSAVINPITIDNNSTSDIIVGGLELIQSPLTAGIIRTIVLTRDGTLESFPRYTYVETNLFFGLGSRFYLNSGADVEYIQSAIKNDFGEVGLNSIIPGTESNGSTATVILGGQYSLARYNFPTPIPIAAGDSFPINLGNLRTDYFVDIAVC